MNKIITMGKRSKTYDVSWHSHNYWEIIYCTSGDGKIVFGSDTLPYNKGNVVVIPPLLEHSNLSEQGFTNIYMTIDDVRLPKDTPIHIADSTSKIFFDSISQAFFFYNCDMHNKDNVLLALGELISSCLIAFSESKRCSPAVEKLKNEILKNFADANFDLSELFAKQTGYSSEYLKKLFTKELKIPPTKFLIDTRIAYAKKLLTAKNLVELSISQIACDCGYIDQLYFSRVFKNATGVSPSKYIG